MSRVDLHVHSRYSDRPTNFFLKKMKAPESLTEPEAAYQLAKRRGMDFFALTDPDTLAGYEEIAHHPDVLPACETTVAFPEDDCKLRLLLFGLSDAQLQHVLSYRGNIFQVRDYLLAEDLFHVVPTPLEVLSARLGPDHIERLLLLFDHFETRSGGRHERTNVFMTALLDSLTPDFMAALRKKWSIEPASAKPWQKGYVGGSNDYCGQYIGLTWTEVEAKSKEELLATLKAGRGTPAGIHGSTLSAAHSMYRVAFQFYQKNLRRRNVREPDLITAIVSRVLQPEQPKRISVRQALQFSKAVLTRALRLRSGPTYIERKLIREFIRAYNRIPPRERLADIPLDDLTLYDERLFSLVDRVIGQVTYRLLENASREFGRGRVGNALSLGAALLPLQVVLGPYLYSFNKLNSDRTLLKNLEARLSPSLDLPRVPGSNKKRIAWFSDTVTDVNGVSLTLHKMAEVAAALNEDLTIVCSVPNEKAPQGEKFLNFEPIGELPVPDYELQKVAVPPGLLILRYLEGAGFTEYVISTPGPVGLIGLLAARLFHVPVRAIYHSDFPEHVRHITGDEGLYETAWSGMRWFYGKADVVYSPSAFYRNQLAERGFDPARLFLFTRGTDLEFFNPKHRDDNFYGSWGIGDRVVFLYTGRVSREKNLDTVLEAFTGDSELKNRAALVIVGDGPYLAELKERYAHPGIAFPGFLKGRDLARAYASADAFVFPSTTDTYGNSVLEAQASGLPSLVSDEGGPKEIIAPDRSGFVLPGHDAAAWRRAMRELLADDLRQRMSSAARARAATRDWTTAFREFWDHDPYPKPEDSKSKIKIPSETSHPSFPPSDGGTAED